MGTFTTGRLVLLIVGFYFAVMGMCWLGYHLDSASGNPFLFGACLATLFVLPVGFVVLAIWILDS